MFNSLKWVLFNCIFVFLKAVINFPIQTLIILPWLLFRKMIISQLELGPPVFTHKCWLIERSLIRFTDWPILKTVDIFECGLPQMLCAFWAYYTQYLCWFCIAKISLFLSLHHAMCSLVKTSHMHRGQNVTRVLRTWLQFATEVSFGKPKEQEEWVCLQGSMKVHPL